MLYFLLSDNSGIKLPVENTEKSRNSAGWSKWFFAASLDWASNCSTGQAPWKAFCPGACHQLCQNRDLLANYRIEEDIFRLTVDTDNSKWLFTSKTANCWEVQATIKIEICECRIKWSSSALRHKGAEEVLVLNLLLLPVAGAFVEFPQQRISWLLNKK